MRYKIVSFVAVLLGAASAFAQQNVSVTFPDASPRTVWVGSAEASSPKDAIKVTQSAIAVPVSDPKGILYVLDTKSGNLASAPVAKVKGGWVVTAKEFSRIGSVLVRVSYAGKPVAAAQVELKDPVRSQSSFLDPSMAGQLPFYNVAPGSLKVTIRYKTGGSDANPVAQVFDEPLSRAAATPILEVAVVQKAATIGEDLPQPGAQAGGSKSVSPPEPSVNPFGKIVGMVFGLALAGAVVYFALQYMKKNSDQVSAKLEQLGVQVPKPQDDEPADPAPPIPAPKQPEPPQKILLDGAAPTPLAADPGAAPISMPGSMPMPVATLTGQPKLVAENGDTLPLDEGELTIGRDVGLGLSLASESTVSRRHAVIVKTGDRLVLRDLGSTNGTYVNGSRLQGETVLRPGDAIQFGAVRFRYEG